MTHDEIEQYLKDKDLNAFEYQLAMDAMLFAEQKTIERACKWIENRHNIAKSIGILTSRTEDLAKNFKRDMEE